MKKVLAICLMMVMAVSMSVNVLAAPGGFVVSPSGNPAPTVVDFDPVDDGCTATLVVTPYSDRHDLPEKLRQDLEDAYKEIADTEDLTKLNEELAKLAEEKNIDGKKLAVSDLFDIHTTGCDEHDNHTNFDITLKADTLNRFIGLMYRDDNGQWKWVSGVKVVNGNHLQFTANGFSPYAIIVDTSAGTPAQTGDSSVILICAVVMAVSAIALVFVLVKGKKRSA